MKKTKKRSALLIALIVLLLATAIGYAAFSTNLSITGSATANMSWDIHFANATCDDSDQTKTLATASIGQTGETLSVAVTFSEPGQNATVSVDVVNGGTIDAKLNSITITAQDGQSQTITANAQGVYQAQNGVIQMELNAADPAFAANQVIAGGNSEEYVMEFSWPDQGANNPSSVNETNTFTIQFNYTQNS